MTAPATPPLFHFDEAENAELSGLDVSDALKALGVALPSLHELVQPTASAFASTLATIVNLLGMPRATVEISVRQGQLGSMLGMAALARQVSANDPELRLEAQAMLDTPKMKELMQRAGNSRINELLGVPQFRSALRALLISATALAWTGIEVLAGDLWEGLLNAHPTAVPVSFAEKVVPLTSLHRYGFDLRRHMGTLLRPKLTFKSVGGIRVAYAALAKTFAAALDCPPLEVLEATRHILVHRAGIIDGDYVDAWKPLVGKDVWFKIGDHVPLNGSIASAFVNTAAVVGTAMLRCADDWVRARPPGP